MCSASEPHYHTCCDDHEDHAAECRNMSCYCYPNPPRYRNGDKHSNGWHDDGRGAKKKKKLGGIWDESESQEREKLKGFWLGLGDDQRQSLLRIEKESILREMREQQRHICSCSVCGRRRTVLEEELELLYDAYYSELEDRGDSGEIDIEMIDYQSDEVDLSLSLKAVEGGVLTVADDLLMDDGRKFFSLMEKLADGRAHTSYEQTPDQYGYGEQEEYEDENYQEEEDEELLEEQRIEEGRRMFQMFAAKMFEQRVLAAYREKVALEKQEQLMQEEEEEGKLQAERKENKARKERERKQKKKELKKQLELEKERKRVEKEQEEQALREKEQLEREEKRKEKQRQKDEEKRRKEEEARRRSLELKERERVKEAKGAGKVTAEKTKDVAQEGKVQGAERVNGARSPEKEAEGKESKSSKKKGKKGKAGLESVAAEASVGDGETAEGWEIAHGKHRKKVAAVLEQQMERPEPQGVKAADETLEALRSTGAARHFEQNGTHNRPSATSPPGFQQPQPHKPPQQAPLLTPLSQPPHSHPVPIPASQKAQARGPASLAPSNAARVLVATPLHGSNTQPQRPNEGIPPGWPKPGQGTGVTGTANGVNGPWNTQRAKTQPELVAAQPQFITLRANHTPQMNPSARPPFSEDARMRDALSIEIDHDLSSSMEHLLPGGLLSATGDTPRGLSASGFEDELARLQLLEARNPLPGIVAARDPYPGVIREAEPPFHDANGHFRQASGSESPESLGSPDSTWSFGRRPGSGSNSSGKLSRPPSADVGRPWMYANGGEEHLRLEGGALRPQSGNHVQMNGGPPLGFVGKAARQDIRVSWDGSQGMLGEPPLFEMVRSASHSALPAPAGTSPPGGLLGRLNGGLQAPPSFHPRWEQPQALKPSWAPGKPFEARLEAAILVLRSAVARQDASGLLQQPLSLSAFWQSLLAIDGGLLSEGVTRSHILAIWVELAKQQVVRIGHADPSRPGEPFLLAMLPPPPPENKLGVCLLCNEALASVQLRPCLHRTCVSCTSQLAAQADFGELRCPFCGGVVQGSATLGADGHFLPGEHPHPGPGERREPGHPKTHEHSHPGARTGHAHRAHPTKAAREGLQSPSQGVGRRDAAPIDQEWPTLEAAVSVVGSRRVEGRPLSGGGTKTMQTASSAGAPSQSRPPSSNGSVGGEVLRKAGWGNVPKAHASPLAAKPVAANGHSKAPAQGSTAWPPLNAAAKGRGKSSGER